MYKNKHLDAELDVISGDFKDCILFQIRHPDLLVAAVYIPPRNSEYFDEIYFKNLQLMLEYFSCCHLIITGDLNSRIGTLICTNTSYTYLPNPDEIVNMNGKILSEICDNIVVMNGFTNNAKPLIRGIRFIEEMSVHR